jgi:hypothetical protein
MSLMTIYISSSNKTFDTLADPNFKESFQIPISGPPIQAIAAKPAASRGVTRDACSRAKTRRVSLPINHRGVAR